MPTQKKFLDEAGLILLLQEIESLDETNVKDLYWSTDNADTSPTIVFKIGDDNGSPNSTKKITFKGDIATAPASATTRNITITVAGVDKVISYYDTTNSTGITYSNSSDTGTPALATSVKAALDRVISKLNGIESGAEVNVQADWNQTTTTADDYIKNKPTFKTINNTAITGSGNIAVQTPLTFDNTPTANSQNPVKSGGVKSAIDAVTTDLDTVETGKGSDMVAYSSSDSVKDALDDIYSQIGSGGDGNSLTSRVGALEDGENLVLGTNVTLTKDTTNHTVTIAAADEKVSQSSDTSTALAIPLLLASGSTPTSPAGAKYNSRLSYKPSTSELKIDGTGVGVGLSFKDGEITFASSLNSATINSTNYSGNAATATKATQDGNGNNIVSTYATKAALDALSDKWTGQFVVLKSSGETAAQCLALKRIIAAEEEGQDPAAADLALFDFGYIYLLENNENGGDNVFDEFIKVTDTVTGTSYYMEKIGTTDAGVDVVSIPATGSNSVASLFETYVLNA